MKRLHHSIWYIAGAVAMPFVTGMGSRPSGTALPRPVAAQEKAEASAPSGPRLLHTFASAPSTFRCLAFAPDGRLAVPGENDTIKIWDVATGRCITTLDGRKGECSGMAFSRDGNTIAAANLGTPVELFDVASGKKTSTIPVKPGIVLCLAYSPDRDSLAFGMAMSHGGLLRLRQVSNGRECAFRFGGYVRGVSFTSDGQILAAAGGGVRVIDQTVRRIHDFKGENADAVALSPAGDKVAYTDRYGLYVYDLASRKKSFAVDSRKAPHAFASVAYSPDGQTIAAGHADGSIRLWDAETGQEKPSLPGHGNKVRDVAFSPDGRRLASRSVKGEVKVWDISRPPAADR